MSTSGRDGETHELKTRAEPFQAVWEGRKTCEVRVDDRDYQVGDALRLREYDPDEKTYSGRSIHTRVTHIVRAPWLPPGLCVMSFGPLGYSTP